MRGATWTHLAELELEQILFYVGVEGGRPETARRLGFEIRDAVDEHLRIGMPGHRHPALPDGWRYVRYKRWLIAYAPTNDGLTVHRVVDAVRDLPRAFGGE